MRLPIGNWVEEGVNWLGTNADGFFQFLSKVIERSVESITDLLTWPSAYIFIAIFTVLAFLIGRWSLSLLTLIGLFIIEALGYWEPTMSTLALVIVSTLLSIVIGIPLGIACGRSDNVSRIVRPVLDFMQTMPAFVYLLPAVFLFGLGIVPGVIASVIFAVPPTIRLTELGIRQVPEDMMEAASAFGSTPMQTLWKVQLPVAMPTLMAGVNQTIMLSLSMVVIASMIGAQGIGAEVYRSVTQLKIGQGFEAGLAVVLLAIILDRFSQHSFKKNKSKKQGA
ncbi:proline/glycine betaine ABC transporter permease [Paenibacillus thiaminolyticus]|uniref:Proline/glycine betaine ABC transporter permease n=1 Tax=Paenibacillus thiaminolyticus TaxID=49283 RepID=A0AAP9J4I3_PANTH|nr:proline/glycine betaine ABC transporter permease [Paenibacillus thiaminolyticus]MCY9535341.1 proline/glycine betaine ABC transporter permease [Paenibacillus thiaminolyticus]MCY9603382.1 proline/glycine betaine ABC transporter permease [Paenibacillus thiaminolyticus]MCY9607375.1 proline/glycine betaine ABC transporter permease [Paenibacillus thiaminolyticus]MCY9616433.1 proline/glycine betaine ABC transporter permease [Paenibacillus thiaminolyticus]MCY9621283.1 proline/glycine betaine ABC tr